LKPGPRERQGISNAKPPTENGATAAVMRQPAQRRPPPRGNRPASIIDAPRAGAVRAFIGHGAGIANRISLPAPTGTKLSRESDRLASERCEFESRLSTNSISL
jgi:hypothetical protein